MMTKMTNPPLAAPAITPGRVAVAVMVALTLLGAAILLIVDPTSPPATVTAVVAARDLAPYTRITAEDVTLATAPQTAGIFTDTGQALGRLTLAAVPRGAPLLAGDTALAPDDAWLMTVSVSEVLTHLAPGDELLLLTEGEPPLPAIFLARHELALDVAVSAADGPRLAAWLTSNRRLTAARRP